VNSATENPFDIGASIPVLPMLDETERARSTSNLFGYEIEWQHRFNDDPASPLYMQIRLGESVLHLNGHEAEQAEIEVADPRYAGTNPDLNPRDPFGHRIVFWLPLKEA